MRDKIKSLLQGAWSSTLIGVDIDKATNSILDEIVNILADVELRHEEQLSVLEDEITDLNAQLDDESSDSDECTVGLVFSTELLQDCLPELNRLLEINSNNPNKYRELNQLIFRIEEQIIKNAK